MTRQRLYWILTGVLITVGVLRPALPDLVRARWAVLVVALAASAALVRYVSSRIDRRPELVLGAILPLVLAVLYLQPQRIASDGIFYYAPLHSVIVDGDLDFENEYRVLGALPGYFQRTKTGRLPNNYSIGPAMLWTPFFLIAHLLAKLGLYRATGFGYPYFTAVATGTALFGFAGVVLTYRVVRAYYPKPALVATVLIWLATFHVWYMVFEPSMSHAMAMASAALFFWYTREGIEGPRAFAVMGALGALVALVRWQNVLFLPAALAVSWARSGRPRLTELAAGGASFVLVFAPQLFYWNAIYGSFLLVPQGGGYIDWRQPELEAVLFSSRHGLLSWAPVLWLGVFGLPGLVRKAPAFGAATVVAIAAAWYVNASVDDWWAGASFGSRRFDAALPVFAIGLAGTLDWLVPYVRRRPLAVVAIASAPFVVWNAMLMGVYFSGAVPADGSASFRQAASDGIELVYPYVGYPPSWPAAARRGLPLSSYDLAGSLSRSNNVDIRMGDTDALYLGRGWSLPKRGRNATARLVRGSRAELFLALSEPAPYTMTVQGSPGGQAEVHFNGDPLSPLVLDASGSATLRVPREAVRAGLNRVLFVRKPRQELRLTRISLRRPGEIR